MKYLPATAIALAIGASVIAGLYITKSLDCLLGLFALLIAYAAIPGKSISEIF
jgi:hypothetical protein